MWVALCERRDLVCSGVVRANLDRVAAAYGRRYSRAGKNVTYENRITFDARGRRDVGADEFMRRPFVKERGYFLSHPSDNADMVAGSEVTEDETMPIASSPSGTGVEPVGSSSHPATRPRQKSTPTMIRPARTS
jgi:hypothetical protein